MIPIIIDGRQYVSNVCEPANGCIDCAGRRNDVLCRRLPPCDGLIFKEYAAPALPAEPAATPPPSYADGYAAGIAYKQAEWDKWVADLATVLPAPGPLPTHQALSRRHDPATSVKAARDMSRKAGRIIDLILVELRGERAMTGKELAAATGVALNSITPRFAQLSRKGLIHAYGGAGRETVWALGNGVQA